MLLGVSILPIPFTVDFSLFAVQPSSEIKERRVPKAVSPCLKLLLDVTATVPSTPAALSKREPPSESH